MPALAVRRPPPSENARPFDQAASRSFTMLAPALFTLAVLTADPAARLEIPFDASDAATMAGARVADLQVVGVRLQGFTPGDVGAGRTNRAAGEFDGATSIVVVPQEPVNAAAFAAGSFTWEGF